MTRDQLGDINLRSEALLAVEATRCLKTDIAGGTDHISALLGELGLELFDVCNETVLFVLDHAVFGVCDMQRFFETVNLMVTVV